MITDFLLDYSHLWSLISLLASENVNLRLVLYITNKVSWVVTDSLQPLTSLKLVPEKLGLYN